MTLEITEDELADARKNWGNALVEISKAFETEGVNAARAVASRALDTVYGFDLGQVLFKPTLASGKQTFRTTRNGALAYFIGHSDEYPGDKGFGIQGWRSIVSETAATFIEGDSLYGLMGTDKDGPSLRSGAGVQKGLRITAYHPIIRLLIGQSNSGLN